jgi:acetylornithine deacetylase
MANDELLARLVAFDSVSRNSNVPLADFICDYLDRPHIRIERDFSPDETKLNLLITVGEDSTDRRGLILSGHMDVVPADEPEWDSDPFVLTNRDGRLYGRGACDMKGFLSLAVNAAAAAEPSRLLHPLVLLLTYDEELGTVGAQHFAESLKDVERLPRAAIVGEPTSLEVVRMHKGHVQFSVSIAGRSAHSAYPHLGRNAIEPAGRVIAVLTELGRVLESETAPNREFFPEVPHATMNIGRISGGSAVNVVPDRCTLDCGMRLLPGMNPKAELARVRDAVQYVLEGTDYEFAVLGEARPMLLRDDAEIYTALCSTMGQDHTASVSYGTDAGWFQQLGVECAIWGPGSIETAHKPNESLPIEEFERAAGLLATVVRRFCTAAD